MHPRSVLRLESVTPWLERHGFFVADRGLLAAALERPWLTFEGRDLYPEIWLKAGAMLDGVISSHPFIDGNKRAGVLLTALAIRAHGVSLEHTDSDDWYSLAISVAVDKPTVEEIAMRLREMVEGS